MYRLAQYRYLAVFTALALLLSFSVALIVPSATAVEEPAGADTVAASESFTAADFDPQGLVDEVEALEAEAAAPITADWQWEMTCDPALGSPQLIVNWDDGTTSVTDGVQTASTETIETWVFNVTHAGTPVGATVQYIVVMPEESPAIVPPIEEIPPVVEPPAGEEITPPTMTAGGGGIFGNGGADAVDPDDKNDARIDPLNVIFSLTVTKVDDHTSSAVEGSLAQPMNINSATFADRTVDSNAGTYVYWVFTVVPDKNGTINAFSAAFADGVTGTNVTPIPSWIGSGTSKRVFKTPSEAKLASVSATFWYSSHSDRNSAKPSITLDRIYASTPAAADPNALVISLRQTVPISSKSAFESTDYDDIQQAMEQMGSSWDDCAVVWHFECGTVPTDQNAIKIEASFDNGAQIIKTTSFSNNGVFHVFIGTSKHCNLTFARLIATHVAGGGTTEALLFNLSHLVHNPDNEEYTISIDKRWTHEDKPKYDCNFILLKQHYSSWNKVEIKTLPAGQSSLQFIVTEPGSYWVGEEDNGVLFNLENKNTLEKKTIDGKVYYGYPVSISGGRGASGGCEPQTFVNHQCDRYGSVKVTKNDDAGLPIAGIKFVLTPVITGTTLYAETDASGIATFSNVLYGNYTLTEDLNNTVGQYYYFNNTTPYSKSVTIDSNHQNVECPVVVNHKKGSLVITKYFNPSTFSGKAHFRVTGPGGFDQSFDLGQGESKPFTGLIQGDYVIHEDSITSFFETSDVTIHLTRTGGLDQSLSITNQGYGEVDLHKDLFQINTDPPGIVSGPHAGILFRLTPDYSTAPAAGFIGGVVEIGDPPLPPQYFCLTDTNGNGTFTLDPSGVGTAAKIPVGNYRLFEVTPAVDFYPGVGPEGRLVTVLLGDNETIMVANYKDFPSGSLIVEKFYHSLDGAAPMITVKIDNGSATAEGQTDGSMPVIFTCNQAIANASTTDNIVYAPAGSYTLTESGLSADDFSMVTPADLVMVPAEGSQYARIDNYRKWGFFIVEKQFSDGMDREVNFRLVGDEKTYEAKTIYDPISGKWLATFPVPTGKYTLYEDTPGGYGSSINGGVPVTVTAEGFSTDQRLPEPYVVVNTPPTTPPGGGDEYTPPTNTYSPPTEVAPPPTEVTPAPPETAPATIPAVVTPAVVEVVPVVTEAAPETALPKTGAEGSAGLALLSMMFAGSGAILRKVSYKK